MVTRPDIMAAFRKSFRYSNTFGGNPVSAAAASAVLDVIETEGLQANAKTVAAYAKAGLEKLAEKYDWIGDVRGYTAERAEESIGFHYGLQWPGRQITSARAIHRVPLHHKLLAEGAVMAERIGWQIPMYFDASGKGWSDRPSLGWQDWSPFVAAESKAAAEAAVLIDQSMYGKIIVQGPDAVRALNHVSGAEMDVAMGISVYSQFLNEKGGVEADVTVTRPQPEQFLVVTGHPGQIRDQALIRPHANPGWASRFSIPPRPMGCSRSTARNRGRCCRRFLRMICQTPLSPLARRVRSTLAMPASGQSVDPFRASLAMNY